MWWWWFWLLFPLASLACVPSPAVEIISTDNLVNSSSSPPIFGFLFYCRESPKVQASLPLFQLLQNFTSPSPLGLEQHLAECYDLEGPFQY